MFIVLKYGLRAGPIAEENWYLFAYAVEKPWMKTGALAIGVMFADLYLQLLKYRALASDEERQATYPKMHYFKTRLWLRKVILLVCLGVCVFTLLIGYSAINDPYLWSMTFNAFYYTGMHMMWVFANAIAIHFVLMGGLPSVSGFLSKPFFIASGKLCFVTALISPIMIQFIYSQLPEGLFLAMVGVNALGIGNIIFILFVGMIMYLLFEFPMRRMLEWSVLPKLSSDKEKHTYFVDLFEQIKARINDLAPLDKAGGNNADESKDLSFVSRDTMEQSSQGNRKYVKNINVTQDTTFMNSEAESPVIIS